MQLDESLLAAFQYFNVASGVLMLAINAPTLWLILRRSGKQAKQYKYYLMYVQINSMATDVLGNFIAGPFFMFPLPCCFMDGLLAQLGVPVVGIVVVGLAVVGSNIIAYSACFIYRHQAVMIPGSVFQLSQWAYVGVLAANSSPLLPLPFTYLFTQSLSNETAMQLSNFSNSQLSRTTCVDSTGTTVLLVLCCIGVAYTAIYITVIIMHIYKTLASLTAMSSRTKKYHKLMTRILMIQVAIPSMCMCSPVCINIVQLAVMLESQLLGQLSFFIACGHSIVHSIVLIATTPSYREAIELALNRARGKSTITVRSISTPSRFTGSVIVN